MLIKSEENINTWLSQLNNECKAAISVDCVIFGYDDESLKVLVLECNMPPFEGLPSLVGDLVGPEENLEEAAQRILLQRTGLDNLYLEQVATFGDVGRHPLGRVISTAYYSMMKVSDYDKIDDASHDRVFWKDVDTIGEMAYDHNNILNVCLERLKKRVREKPIGFNLLPKKFTLMQLQALYEVILGIELDKRNFRRKIKGLDILKEHDEGQKDVAHRPAKYYSFDREAYHNKRKKGISFEI